MKSFSKAIMRHVNFSKGLYFTADLKRLNEMMEAEGFEVTNKMDFSYNFEANMKIDYAKLTEDQRKDKMKKAAEGI